MHVWKSLVGCGCKKIHLFRVLKKAFLVKKKGTDTGFRVYDGIFFFMDNRVLTTFSTDRESKNCCRLTYNAIF